MIPRLASSKCTSLLARFPNLATLPNLFFNLHTVCATSRLFSEWRITRRTRKTRKGALVLPSRFQILVAQTFQIALWGTNWKVCATVVFCLNGGLRGGHGKRGKGR